MNEIIIERLKRNMKALRVKAGYTQEDVADLLYVTRETVFRWEKEPERMSFVKLADIAKLYNCTVNDFFAE